MKNSAVTMAPSISLLSLGKLSLRLGDNDATGRWGGVLNPQLRGRPVHELQEALIAVGTLKKRADGDFGQGTQNALRRFQWYLNKMDYRLKVPLGANASTGLICVFGTVSSGLLGTCDAWLGTELVSWVSNNFITTTPLVRLNLSRASNLDTSEAFRVLDYPGARDGEVLVHEDFAGVMLGTMNDAAKTANVTLKINQTFRVQGIPPSGAVVTPASKSQHFIGHAVDLNILDGETLNNSAMLTDGSETENADTFIATVKKRGIRWGGDFNGSDPVHFDDFVNPAGEDYPMIFFFVQRCYHERHPMRVLS